MNIYVAASWRTEAQPYVVQGLRAIGHTVYDFRDDGFSWREVDGDWKNWTPAQARLGLLHETAQRGFKRDRDALDACDGCVLLLPSASYNGRRRCVLRDLKVFLVYCWRRLLMRLAQSTWGYCFRCARPWGGKGKTAPHQTWFGKRLPNTKGTFGIFPLCESCWQELGTYERRVPFYRRLQRMWVRDGASEDLTQWAVISAALKKESEEA